MTNIAVIGSNSFSGQDFVDLLLEDSENQVIGISRSPEKSELFLKYKRHNKPNFRFYQYDLNNNLDEIKTLLESFEPEYIVNFAAQSEVAESWDNPAQWFQTNTVALANLCNYLKTASYLKKYVHISSPEVYGTCVGTVVESTLTDPSTPYAASKMAADLLLFTFFKHYHFPLVVIRSTNVYGACQQLFKIIPRSIIYMKADRVIRLHGGGYSMKSYIHIRDISRGELLAMKEGEMGEIYHLSPDEGIVVRDLVKNIAQKLGKDFQRVTQDVGERLGQDAAYVIDSGKARRTFDWKPEITLDEGLDRVIKWVNLNWDEIKQEPLEYIHKP